MAARVRWRGTTTERGLGAGHQAKGKRARAALQDGDLCWRCGQRMYHSQQLDLDHVTARALGGADGPAVLAHAHCNRSAGARMGNQMRGRRKPSAHGSAKPSLAVPLRTSRQW